jgi:hypothetical protein
MLSEVYFMYINLSGIVEENLGRGRNHTKHVHCRQA